MFPFLLNIKSATFQNKSLSYNLSEIYLLGW